jgi:ribosomal protein S18 acetylase RimI-like enzyme
MPNEVLDNLSISEREIGWREALTTERPNILVAEEDSTVRGFVHFGLAQDERHPSSETGEVYALYLLAASQGRGFGRALWNHAIQELREQGCAKVVVWVLETNQLARRFYERCGCVLDGTPREITIGGKSLVAVRYVLQIEGVKEKY